MATYSYPNDGPVVIKRRDIVERTINDWCFKNNIDFFGTYQPVWDLKFEKIVKLTFFELMMPFDSLCQLDDKLNREGKHLFYLTDNLVNESQCRTFDNITIISVNQWFGIIQLNSVIQKNINPSKLFNCFIQRVDPVRQSWFYFLKDRGLLNNGYVSFLLDQRFEITGLELFDHNHYQYNLDKLEHFHNAYLTMRDRVPYRNFPSTDDLISIANKTKYSLVIETYAVEDDHIGYCYTEKSHRALQTPTINLLFSQKRSLAKLAELGFKIDPYMLEIDQLDWINRQQKILDILTNDSIAFDADLLYNNALHNRELIHEYKKQFISGLYLEELLTKIIDK